jgi:hypothetical protein
MSYPGMVLPECGNPEGGLEIHHLTGRTLRIDGEINLCFNCGPDGGVYHPDEADMPAITKEAAKLNARFNKFEKHTHSTLETTGKIEHSHCDGSDRHNHPGTGPGAYDMTQDEAKAYMLFAGSKPKKLPVTKRPWGPQLEYVEVPEEESTFRVIISARYDGTTQAGKWEGRNNALYTRAEFRRSLELYILAIRNPGFDPVGHGAIAMTTARLILRHRLTPIYEIVGWEPTPRMALP